jgi:hypothetical protein
MAETEMSSVRFVKQSGSSSLYSEDSRVPKQCEAGNGADGRRARGHSKQKIIEIIGGDEKIDIGAFIGGKNLFARGQDMDTGSTSR